MIFSGLACPLRSASTLLGMPFICALATSEWAFAKLLSSFSNPDRTDFILGVSNRKKSSGLKFSPEDGYIFAHLFALALYSYENGIPATIKAIKSELKESKGKKVGEDIAIFG